MKIAPIDIAHKVFGRKINGLDGAEVESFLKDVASEMENLIRERNQLKEQIREREIQMLEYKERDKALKETIMTAHKMTEKLRADGEREAALIINDAKQRADSIIRDSRDGLKKAFQELTDLKRQKIQFEVALKSLVGSHLELIERNNGLIPHVSSPESIGSGGSTPNLRQGKPILES